MGIFNDSSNSESQILKYKRDKELDFLCDGNKLLVIIVNICVIDMNFNQMLLILFYSMEIIFFEHIKFCQIKGCFCT